MRCFAGNRRGLYQTKICGRRHVILWCRQLFLLTGATCRTMGHLWSKREAPASI
uniref:Uncharacterized protein n=1 Tax=Arundo donax TaxID=35708 RepID=A0A0A9GGZ0_ARUDO